MNIINPSIKFESEVSLSSEPASQTKRGYLAAFGATLFLATTAIFIHYLTLNFQLPALVLTFWRELFTALSLFLILRARRPALLHVPPGHLAYLISYGFVLAVFNSMWALSVAFNGAAAATVLVYSSAAFTTVLGWLILKEKLGWIKLTAVLMSLAGCALTVNAFERGAWLLSTAGMITGLLSGLSYAAYSLMGRSASQRGLNSWTTLLYIFAFAAAIMLLVNLVMGPFLPGGAKVPLDLFWLGSAWDGWLVLFILAAVPTLLGFGLYNLSLKYLPAGVANLILTMEPVFTAIFAYLLFGEMLAGIQILGGVLILAGVLLIRLNRVE